MTGDRSGEREKDEVHGRERVRDDLGAEANPESRRSLSGERVSDISPMGELRGVCPVGRGGENEAGEGLRGEGRRGEEVTLAGRGEHMDEADMVTKRNWECTNRIPTSLACFICQGMYVGSRCSMTSD